jgi:hypothetical protein
VCRIDDQLHDYVRRGNVLKAFTVAPEDAPDWVLASAQIATLSAKLQSRIGWATDVADVSAA